MPSRGEPGGVLSDRRCYAIAAAGAALGAVGLVAAGVEIAALPEPRGDGLPAAFAAAFAIGYVLSALVAIGEAGLLAGVVRLTEPGRWGRRVLATGAAAGALAMLPRAVATAGFATPADVDPAWIGGWWVLAVLGALAAGVGILVVAVEPLDRLPALLLAAAGVALPLVVVATAAVDPDAVLFVTWVLLPVVPASAILGGGLAVADRPVDRLTRLAILAVGLLGVAASLASFLADRPTTAAVVGLIGLVVLWAAVAVGDAEPRPA